MPFVRTDGADLYWEQHGSGAPVLLIMGLSYTHEMWFRVVPALSQCYRVVLYDNRGVGQSSVPPGPYRIKQMAEDAAAVMTAAGIESAPVIGASMGGMVAQELALRYPQRVQGLLLGCTSYAGLFARWPAVNFRMCRDLYGSRSRRQAELALIALLYADTTPLERIREDLEVQCRSSWNQRGFLNQFAGILMWSSYFRLPAIKQPTLVVHGDRDRLVPASNGRVVASRIPGAKFRIVRDAGHILMTDQPEICTGIMLDFLAGLS